MKYRYNMSKQSEDEAEVAPPQGAAASGARPAGNPARTEPEPARTAGGPACTVPNNMVF